MWVGSILTHTYTHIKLINDFVDYTPYLSSFFPSSDKVLCPSIEGIVKPPSIATLGAGEFQGLLVDPTESCTIMVVKCTGKTAGKFNKLLLNICIIFLGMFSNLFITNRLL